MARSKTLIVNGKTVVITEKKLGELEAMMEKLSGIKTDGIVGANNIDDLKKGVFGLVYDNIPEFFPPLKKEDVPELYPSDIENLIEGFIDVNFFGLKRLAVPIMGMVKQAMKK